LQLGVIAAAGAEIGIGPAMVEHILPIGVRFQIAGHAGGEPPRLVLHEEMLRQPAGLASGGTAVLQRPQKGMSGEWVIRAVCGLARITVCGADVPRLRRNAADIRGDADADAVLSVGRVDSARTLLDIAHG